MTTLEYPNQSETEPGKRMIEMQETQPLPQVTFQRTPTIERSQRYYQHLKEV